MLAASMLYGNYVEDTKVDLYCWGGICLSFTCFYTKEFHIPHIYISVRKQMSSHLTFVK